FMILETKRNAASDSCQIVSDASSWLKSELKGADVKYQYGACENELWTFSSFTLVRDVDEEKLSFELKIAEIDHTPYAFVDVHPVGKAHERRFPFFGEIESDEGKKRVLHYIADFLLSTEVPE
ncbi:MAG: hypothetical protein ACQKBT_02070, partial [Puniceicoccales bacterium]